MIPHLDMITLLLCVFIALFAESMLNISKVRAVAASMIKAFGGASSVQASISSGSKGIMNQQPAAVPKPKESPHRADKRQTTIQPVIGQGVEPKQIIAQKMQKDIEAQILAIDKLHQELEKMLHSQIEKGEVSILAHTLSLRIRVNATILFPNGQANLTPPAQKLLTTIAGVLATIPPGYQITVQGYTDDRPIHTRQFSSNWALSAARSVSVVELFAAKSIPGDEMSAEGYSKFRPLASNDTATGRSANRRVEIYIAAPNASRQHVGKPD